VRAGRRPPSFFALAVLLLLAAPLEAQQEGWTAPAQEGRAHPTALESYLDQPGTLLVKRRHALEPIALANGATLRLDALSAQEPGMEHQRVMGIRVEVEAAELASEERILYLDVHEIDELVRSIHFMESAIAAEESERPGDGTEMSIATRDGLVVGVGFSGGAPKPFLGIATARFALGLEALTRLRANLDQGRKRLFSE
jgi:hypothetical protein